MKIYHAAYIAILLHFLRRIMRNFIPDGIERSLWFNLESEEISLRVYTSADSVLLNAIKNKMVEHQWKDSLLSIGPAKFNKVMDLDNARLELHYSPEYISEIREILKEFGLH